jgi:hypothetical protein
MALLAIHRVCPPVTTLRTLTACWATLLRSTNSHRDTMGNSYFPNDIPSVFYTFVYQLSISNLILVEVEKPKSNTSDSEHLFEDTIPQSVQYYTPLVPIPVKLPKYSIHHPVNSSSAALGQGCLVILESQLKPSSLSSCSRDRLRVLFLLVFGVLMLVASAEPVVNLPPFPEVSQVIHFPKLLSTNRQSGRSCWL